MKADRDASLWLLIYITLCERTSPRVGALSAYFLSAGTFVCALEAFYRLFACMISLTGLMLSSTWFLLNSAKFLKSDSISYLSKFELTSPIIAYLYTAAPSRIYSLDWSMLEYSGNNYGIPFWSVTFSAIRCPNCFISRTASNISVSSAPVAFFSDPAISTDFL